MASKFSKPKPSGSIELWQEAQVGFARCCSICCRSVPVAARLPALPPAPARPAAAGAAACQQLLQDPLAALHRRGARRVRRHASARWPASGRRRAASAGTRHLRNSSPFTSGDAVVPGQPLVDEGVSRRRGTRGCCGPRARWRRRTARVSLPHRLAQRRRRTFGNSFGSGVMHVERCAAAATARRSSHQSAATSGPSASAGPAPPDSCRSLPFAASVKQLARRACVLHRKYDSRVASSYSLIGVGRSGRRAAGPARRGTGSAARPARPAAPSWIARSNVSPFFLASVDRASAAARPPPAVAGRRIRPRRRTA